MKKFLSVLLAALMLLALTACGGGESTQPPADNDGNGGSTPPASTGAAEYTIKVGHTLQEDTPTHKGFLVFQEEVEKNSSGRIAVELYPNSSLGSERVMFEACQMGTLEVAYGTTSVLANFDKTLQVLDLPFLFTDEAKAREAMVGELGQAAAANLGNIGLLNLTYMENGIRHLMNNSRPVNTPDDVKGLKIRTMENLIHMSAFTHLGASPTPMAFTELFTALQQGTVDGNEQPIFLIKSSRFEEVQKYLSLTGHFYTAGIATINKAFFESLPEDLQTVVMDAAGVAREAQYAACDEDNASALEYLKTKMEVNEISPENHQLFVDATASVYDEVEAEAGSEIMAIARAAQAG
ncbi:MAG: DctP family TRAP transporter solute-binding subunit [Oscillibacter sp.]|nr:DctP family TRAP transporter solute-binding subunit [Oscillibacter sp.]